jgi:hypothetical protein
MRSNSDKRSEVVPPEDVDTVDPRDHALPFGLRIKPDRRQRNVPILPHPDRRKRTAPAPSPEPPAGKIEMHHR